jgi:hypothetical protein
MGDRAKCKLLRMFLKRLENIAKWEFAKIKGAARGEQRLSFMY